MHKLKQLPEDFIVREINSPKFKGQGRYLYYRLIKKNYNTSDIIRKLAKTLHLKEKQIGFAGNKDKQALTEQAISFKEVNKNRIEKLNFNNIKLEFLGCGDEPITLGSHLGNYFEIVIRNLEKEKINNINCLENYFDEQRFSGKNCEIGRLLVKKEFKTAVLLINNLECKNYLKLKPSDTVGALKKLSTRLLKLYVNAYQSYLWNETVKRYFEQNYVITNKINYSLGEFVFTDENDPDLKIPLLGFGLDSLKDTKLKKIIEKIMETEKLTSNDFIIKPIPEISAEGELRTVFVEVKDLVINNSEKDDLNSGKKKVKVSFSLPKGSYATMAVRKMVD
ncbi:tRNA pseudouridine(13) synthase TruD [Candidatus Woesearchaeota archaeon]|nr:tRNA pseudouridine(13) synthase TruD [Candidatus Woesearchaeota archaeon]